MVDKIVLWVAVLIFICLLKVAAAVFGLFLSVDIILTGLLAAFLVNYLSRE